MNFFERQEDARRKSLLLLVQFLVAVVLILLAVNLVAWLLLHFRSEPPAPFWQWARTAAFWKIAAVTATVILAGSLNQYLRLRSGGEAVARMAGARPLDPESRDENERRFINVVEEMSIAAGVAMPRLYVMEREAGINAFVAGHRPDQAVMAVTRGALEHLSRDELQGVVGHEFSHILNGDMRLNLRLMAVLAGILALGQLGEFLLRSIRDASRSRDGSKAIPILLVGGLSLVVVGYLGLFLGRLIKAAISRQREYLADASSVQFTRNPQGLAGALYRIRTLPQASRLTATLHAEDMNHLCFSETLKLRFSGLLASHPPLDERIRAIDPLYLPKARAHHNRQRLEALKSAAQQTTPSPLATGHVMASGFAAAELGNGTDVATALLTRDSSSPLKPNRQERQGIQNQPHLETLGQLQEQHHEYAEQLLGRWPESLRQWTRQPTSAKALIAALLVLETDPADQTKAQAWLKTEAQALNLDDSVFRHALLALPSQGKESRLPIVELCLGSLKGLPQPDRVRFIEKMAELAGLDGRHRLFEFVLISLLHRQLAPGAARAPRVRYHSFKPVLGDISRLITVLARLGTTNLEELRNLHAEVMRSFGQPAMEVPTRCTLNELNASLQRLSGLSPLLKQPLLQSCVDVVLKDGRVDPEEYELLRATAEVLDCPLPPLA